MKIEDKAYFDGGYFRTAATPLSLFTKDLRETLRRLAAFAECPILGYGKLTTQSEFSNKINQLKTWITADIAKIEKDKLKEKESSNWIRTMDKWIEKRKEVIAELKKIEDTKISLLPTVAKNAIPVEDKAYFAKPKMDDFTKNHLKTYIENRYRGKDKQKIYSAMLKVWEDNPEYWSNEGWASVEKAAGFSMPVEDKAYFDRQGSKAKMGFLSGTKKQQIDYVFGVGTNYGERAWKSGIKRLIDDKEALARIRLLKYELDPSSPMRNTVDKEFDKGWLKGYTSQQIQESENPPKFKKGDRVLYNTGTAKHIGTIEKVSPYAKPEAEYIVAFTTLSTGRSQLNIPESSINKSNASRTGLKARFKKEWTEAGFSASFFIKKLQGMMAVYQGENDNEYRNKIIGYAKTLANHPDFVFNGVSSQALAKKAFTLVKFKYARVGTKQKFAKKQVLWGIPPDHWKLPKKLTPLMHGSFGEKEWDKVVKLAEKDGWTSLKFVPFNSMPDSWTGKGQIKNASQGSKARFAATRIWPNDYGEINNANAKYARLIFDRQKIIRANAGRRIKGEQPLEVPAPPTAPEFPFAFSDGDYVGLVLGGQANVPKGATVKWAHNANLIKMSRTGTKSKFANRGAFAEASSSPVLGSLLEKKVMPEGGWRAVETDGGALVIAFEDGDIAGNFARRASENGYSATAPMAMAGRFWNVKVQNENKN